MYWQSVTTTASAPGARETKPAAASSARETVQPPGQGPTPDATHGRTKEPPTPLAQAGGGPVGVEPTGAARHAAMGMRAHRANLSTTRRGTWS